MTVSQNSSYSDERKSATRTKRALCLVDNSIVVHLNETLELLGWRLDVVDTIQQAVNALQRDQYEAIIAAISTSNASLFDDSVWDEASQQMVYRSSLLSHALRKSPTTFRVVYGFEAVELDDIRRACFHCGADTVVNSSEALFDVLFGLSSKSLHDCQYQVIDSEVERHLKHLSGGALTHRLKPRASIENPMLITRTDVLQDHRQLPFHVSLEAPTPGDSIPSLLDAESRRNLDCSQFKSEVVQAPGSGPPLRVIHISDTVGLHRQLSLPEGDVLLHSGNFTDGKKGTWFEQFRDFLNWIRDDVLPSFRRVVFIAGSNDIFLDIIACKYNAASREAQRILNTFMDVHRTVIYLENSSITYQGLKIYGTPLTLLKGGATINPGAFERVYDTYVRPELLDNDYDILLTHRPPSFILLNPRYEILTDALYFPEAEEEQRALVGKISSFFRKDSSKKKKSKVSAPPPKPKFAPRLHAYGHYGNEFGVEDEAGTLLLNGAQDKLLEEGIHSGGIPLMVDVPIYR